MRRFLIFVFVFYFNNLFSQNIDNIILVDCSRSMINIIDRVKDAINNVLITEARYGDRVIIARFGDRDKFRIIKDRIIENKLDKIELRDIVYSLRAEDDWTYLVEALDNGWQKLQELHNKNPTRGHILYLLTDGKDEPDSIDRESREKMNYDVLLSKYENVFKYGTFAVIKFGSRIDPELTNTIERIEEKGGDTIIVDSVSSEKIGEAIKRAEDKAKKFIKIKKISRRWDRLKYIVLAIIVIVGIIVFARIRSIPKFPEKACLFYVNESGDIMSKFYLRDRQKPLSKILWVSQDIPIVGMGSKTFCLIAEFDGVYIESKQNMKLNGEDEPPNKKVRLMRDSEFIIGKWRFKYTQ